MGTQNRKKSWAFPLYALALGAFTAYVLLNTFLVSRVYVQAAPAETAESTQSAEAVVTETEYQDGNISIRLSAYRVEDSAVYMADIQLASPEYLKTALADNAYGKNLTEKTSVMARSAGAILAINGDYYGVQESGYVLRNGVLYRDTPVSGKEDLVIFADGSFRIIREDEISAQSLLEAGAEQILSFGPALVENGEVSVEKGQEVSRAKSGNPRTAIGIVGQNHYVFVVSDGRTSDSQGLSLYELAEFMQSLGVTTAYNLDGGGSSTLYFNGQVVNQPTTNGKRIQERSVSDIVCIGY